VSDILVHSSGPTQI